VPQNRNVDLLIAELSLDERQELLEKLGGEAAAAPEPLYEDRPDDRAVDLKERYVRLPGYSRFWLFLKSLLTGRQPQELFEEGQAARLGREIEKRFPGVYDYKKGRLLDGFRGRFAKLKDAARFFYTALAAGFDFDKGAFYGFLGSLEMPLVHKQLEEAACLSSAASGFQDAAEAELRQAAFGALDEALGSLTEELKSAMYADVRYLFCLKQLASFPFDKILRSFSGTDGKNSDCSISAVSAHLAQLNDILYSLALFPPPALLESLFVFLLRKRAGEAAFDLHKEIGFLSEKAEKAAAVIRDFNRKIPLTKILRCANRNMALSPAAISGGEDWFAVYREYWKRRVETAFDEYIDERRRRELAREISLMLKGADIKFLENLYSESNPDGMPVNGGTSLSFLSHFYQDVFSAGIAKIIGPLFLDGVFYRAENRVEFSESYNDLVRLSDKIQAFDAKISSFGEYGRRYYQAREDADRGGAKRQHMQKAVEDASAEAAAITASARKASLSMFNILDGILNHNILANLHLFTGKGSRFIKDIETTARQFQDVNKILDDIDRIENG